ncbi:MAG: DUF2332 family protein, partial [Solirubrobacteraceae bacterium]
MPDRAALARRFAVGDTWFHSSPLYRVLARAVVNHDRLLDLAALVRPGQQPANMLMAAVHLVVLRHPELPFARFFQSVRGDDAEPPAGAGAELAGFCAEHRDAIAEILRTRLVQTNEAGRGVSVRLAMHEVARRVDGPVTFLEIGPSAGIQLRFDCWAVELAGRRFGPAGAPLTLRPQWRGDRPPPDLNDLPPIRRRLGVDLNPVDAADPEQAADGAEQRGAVLIGEPKRVPRPAPDHWRTTTHPGDRGEACRRTPCIVVVPDTTCAWRAARVGKFQSSTAEQPDLGRGRLRDTDCVAHGSPTLATGKICYLQIPADDVQRSSRFYADAFGWELRTHGDGTIAFDDAVKEVSGSWVTGRPPSADPGIMVHVMVADL